MPSKNASRQDDAFVMKIANILNSPQLTEIVDGDVHTVQDEMVNEMQDHEA